MEEEEVAIESGQSPHGPPPSSQSTIAVAPSKNVIPKDILQIPIFMQSLDDVPDGTNDALEALKALAYEGEPSEVAENFRQQGNDCYRARKWRDAVEFYSKGIAVGSGVDDIEEACYVNRAAANLELGNYRRTITDCSAALKRNQQNVKAWYRASRAYLALDKIAEATNCVDRGLEVDEANDSLHKLANLVADRGKILLRQDNEHRERADSQRQMETVLQNALQMRGVIQRSIPPKPDLPPNARVHLEEPMDPNSTLNFPVVILYPMLLQSDFLASVTENDTVHLHIQQILSVENRPQWDNEAEYLPDNVEVIVERKKDAGRKAGLSKMGKNITIRTVLQEGKLELINGVLSVFVIPKKQVTKFVEVWKTENQD